jgi:alpha-galactosidase
MTGIVTIDSGGDALVLALPERGMPQIVAYGLGARGADLAAERGPRVNGMDVPSPTAVLLPTGGMGFFGWPAIAGHRDGRDFIFEPRHWSSERRGSRHCLKATDPVAKLAIEIEIEAGADVVFAMRSRLTNLASDVYTLDRCMAGSLLIEAGEAELTSFTGSWGRELHRSQGRLGTGVWLQESRRGRTSHDKFPGVLIQVGDARYGLHVGASGNHVIAIDRLDDGRRLAHGGELFEPGEIRLAEGEHYESPWVHITSKPEAMASHARSLVRWPGGTMRPRPVTLNTWEGNYFDHKLESLKAQADGAAALGIERFVLDDGWFGRRDDDTSSLGDWFVDARKYPDGLGPLVEHVRGLGMEFGIWVEPEMVNENSDLFRSHPDWALQVAGRPLLSSRHQLVLDLTRAEVTDYLFERIDALLRAHPISYLKWDMNRDLTHVGDRDGRAATARQTAATYALMDRIRAAHPMLEIESCASGGGRTDYGVLERTHRLWTSDCTDALDRLEIQHGAAMFFPREILGAHVSASPNHQTHRRHTLDFRALVAIAYHFGVELNPLTLTGEERESLGGWIGEHKRLRQLLHAPRGQFQLPPVDGRYVWGSTSENRIVAIVAQSRQMLAEQPPPLRLPDNWPARGTWRIASHHPVNPDFIRMSESQRRVLAGEATFSLQTLTRSGLALPMLRPESGVLLEFVPVTGA